MQHQQELHPLEQRIIMNIHEYRSLRRFRSPARPWPPSARAFCVAPPGERELKAKKQKVAVFEVIEEDSDPFTRPGV
jgi:hypothetical protein